MGTITEQLSNIKVPESSKATESSDSAKTPAKLIPMEQNETFIKSLLAVLQGRVFEFHYRAKYRPQMAHIVAMDLDAARELAQDYCEKFHIRFISVTPFFMDLKKNPRETADSGE